MIRWLLKICCFLLFYFGKFHKQDKWGVPAARFVKIIMLIKLNRRTCPDPRDVLFNLTEPNSSKFEAAQRLLLRQICPAVCSASFSTNF